MTATNIYSNQWIDQVFAKHNKSYGAYQLRKRADDYTITGLLAAVLIVSAAFLSPVFIDLLKGKEPLGRIPNFDEHIFSVVDPPLIPPAIVVPPVLPATTPRLTSELINPQIINDKNANDDNSSHDDLNDNPNNINATLAGTGNPNDTVSFAGEPKNPVPAIDTNIYRGSIEINPQFPGGEDAMMKFLISNLKYPRNFITENISGTVYISFIVNRDGDVTGIDVLRGIYESKDFEKEAMRVVAIMPKWKPGRQNGQNVSVCFTLPVRFSLK